jgi:hypothetical protein
MTLHEVFDIVLDTHVIGCVPWLRALTVAVSELKPAWSSDEETAFEHLSGWDGRADPNRWGPALYREWRQVCREAGRAVDEQSISTATALSEQTKGHLIKALREAVRRQKQRYGHLGRPVAGDPPISAGEEILGNARRRSSKYEEP